MREDLLVLLEPGVHRVPVEADVVAELLDRRVGVVPCGGRARPAAGAHVEGAAVAPARRVLDVAAAASSSVRTSARGR